MNEQISASDSSHDEESSFLKIFYDFKNSIIGSHNFEDLKIVYLEIETLIGKNEYNPRSLHINDELYKIKNDFLELVFDEENYTPSDLKGISARINKFNKKLSETEEICDSLALKDHNLATLYMECLIYKNTLQKSDPSFKNLDLLITQLTDIANSSDNNSELKNCIKKLTRSVKENSGNKYNHFLMVISKFSRNYFGEYTAYRFLVKDSQSNQYIYLQREATFFLLNLYNKGTQKLNYIESLIEFSKSLEENDPLYPDSFVKFREQLNEITKPLIAETKNSLTNNCDKIYVELFDGTLNFLNALQNEEMNDNDNDNKSKSNLRRIKIRTLQQANFLLMEISAHPDQQQKLSHEFLMLIHSKRDILFTERTKEVDLFTRLLARFSSFCIKRGFTNQVFFDNISNYTSSLFKKHLEDVKGPNSDQGGQQLDDDAPTPT